MTTAEFVRVILFRMVPVVVLTAGVVVSLLADPGPLRTTFAVLGVAAGVPIFGYGLVALVRGGGRVFSTPYPLGTVVVFVAFIVRDSIPEWAYLAAVWVGIALIVVEGIAWSRSTTRKRQEEVASR